MAAMTKFSLVLLASLFFSTSLHAADKIRIGYPDFNSSTFTMPLAQIRGFFQEEGLQAELIRIRSAVATAGSAPVDYLGKKMGYVVLARAYDLFSYPNTGLVASVKKIKDRPDQLKRVIKAGIKANRYLHQNREGTIQAMMQWMKIDKETAAATYDGSAKSFNEDGSVPQAGLRIAIDEAKKATNISREISITEVADLTVLREAQKEMGIK